MKQFLTFVNGAPFQPAIAAGLDLPDAVFAGHRLRPCRQARHPDRRARGGRAAGLAAAGGYFVIADGAALGYSDGAELCRRLPELARVVAVPVSAFCRDEQAERMRSLVRFAACKSPAVLAEASTRLAALAAR